MLKKISRLLVVVMMGAIVTGISMEAIAKPVDPVAGNPIAKIAEEASPAVVNIDTETMVKRPLFPFADDPFFRQFFGDQWDKFTQIIPMKGKGSGFIVSKDGYILTNNHVIEGADKITVSLADGRQLDAKIVGKDPTFDLAVIKVTAGNLPVLPLGDSDAVQVGEWVVAIGNPFGLDHTVTVGVISAKNRSIRAGNVSFDGFLQTDAAINPGNSGGPLLDLDGKVVGINTAIIPYAQGIGFAIPVNMAKSVIDDLVSYGRVRRGWLGVYVQPLTSDIAQAYGLKVEKGAVVADVVPDSPADKAGIKRGFVITKVDGVEINDAQDLVFQIRKRMAGDKIKIEIATSSGKRSVTVTLEEIPGQTEAPRLEVSDLEESLGIEVSPVTPALKQKYNIDSEKGVVVVGVKPGSISDRVGIREGDLILEANGVTLKTVDDLKKALQRNPDSVVLLVMREGRTFFISLRK
ncbi:serine protease Do [Acetomicrobium thermoterrenum DSM 13490]|uniref:Serine protease Do n=2 Tax=Acetomicrobium TaxID=49894 RepID=A0A1H3F249_9BACT|nr:Do family serine endopeptidase [Acetomicrobium thermoterrenum]SDX85096.1 serine protease Do [Acetomicrobium thermoterrenum DSM 13490]